MRTIPNNIFFLQEKKKQGNKIFQTIIKCHV